MLELDVYRWRIDFVVDNEFTFEDPDGGGKVVDATRSAQGSREDFNGGDEIVSEAVVQVALVK